MYKQIKFVLSSESTQGQTEATEVLNHSDVNGFRKSESVKENLSGAVSSV